MTNSEPLPEVARLIVVSSDDRSAGRYLLHMANMGLPKMNNALSAFVHPETPEFLAGHFLMPKESKWSAPALTCVSVGKAYLEEDVAFIDFMETRRDLRGQGLGSQVLRALEDVACNRNILDVHISAASRRTIPFYETNGYTVLPHQSGDFQEMHKTLTPLFQNT